jgi:hypothetical protein
MDKDLEVRYVKAVEKIAHVLDSLGYAEDSPGQGPGGLEYVGVALGGKPTDGHLPDISVASGLHDVAEAIRDLAEVLRSR